MTTKAKPMSNTNIKISFSDLRAVRFVCEKCKSTQEISIAELVKRAASATKSCPFLRGVLPEKRRAHQYEPYQKARGGDQRTG
jgi:hypothetical protein